MDRQSWLWRRKSSEISPGAMETESSGSLSSYSERFSDEQAYSNQTAHSPEVTSKDVPLDERLNDDDLKILRNKLSVALMNISAKEELVKQHSKVAEEAVSGWEKAENEVSTLRQQVDILTTRNSALEDRVDHLDGALKECLRQLRQAREEREQKTREAIDKKISEWQSTKSQLENQIVDLQSQLQASKSGPSISSDTELLPRLDTVEKENSTLKLELCSVAEDLEFRTIERDLNAQAAETVSKLHLESKRKVVKLEAECRRLKSAAKKGLATNDYCTSVNGSSVYAESIADSQSESGERVLVVEGDGHKMRHDRAFERNLVDPTVETNLMDDFLEMERLVALPDNGGRNRTGDNRDTHLKDELDASINRRSELEDMIEKMGIEKVELEINMTKHQAELTTSRNRLSDAEAKLVTLETLVFNANEAKKGADMELESSKGVVKKLKDKLEKTEMKLGEVKKQLNIVSEARRLTEADLETTHVQKEMSESKCIVIENELKTMLSKVCSLEDEVQKERALSGEMDAKCQKLMDKILRMQSETEHRKASILNGELKIKQEMELQVAGSKFAECQKTIASLSRQVKSLATLDDFLIDPESPLEVS